MAVEDRIVSVESGGDANARNPNSTAAGPGQFIDATWLDMLARHRPDLTGSRADLLALKTDPNLSRDMTAAYAADNGGILSKSGLPVTPGTQYLAHFAGPQGAVGLLNADPSTPAGAVLGAGVVKANPFLARMTAGDVAAWADRKMGGAAPARSAPMSIAGPAVAGLSTNESAAKSGVPASSGTGNAGLVDQGRGSPSASPASLDALAAVPQLRNLLPQRPNIFGLNTAPFSLRG